MQIRARQRRQINTFVRYVLLSFVGIIMLYPLIWMVFSTFKTNAEIFGTYKLLPTNWTISAYQEILKMYGGQINLPMAMKNTYIIVFSKVALMLFSVTLTAYGFARFNFVGRNVFYAIMISTIFLPQTVLNAPQYIMYNSWGWINSYKPLIVPTLFAIDSYFIFMIVQFMRGIPCEMEEAATIDGCNSVQTLIFILVPMLVPALVSAALFQFLWSSNDFMGPLIYIRTTSRQMASVFIKMCMDTDKGTDWNRVLAFSLIAIMPSLLVFFAAQSTFIEGIAAGSIKG